MFKRSVAGLLLGVTLFTGYSATYLQAREVKASATGAYTLLYTLFEYVMASCGLAVTNKADNEALCDAFCNWYETRLQNSSLTTSQKLVEEMKMAALVVAGARVKLSDYPEIMNAMVKFINQFCKTSKSNKSSSRDYSVFDVSKVYWNDDPTSDSWGYPASYRLLKKYGYSPNYSNVFNGQNVRNGNLLAYYHKEKCSFSYDGVPYSGEVFVTYYVKDKYGSYDYKRFYPFSNEYYLTDDLVVHRFNTTYNDLSLPLYSEIIVCDKEKKEFKKFIYGLKSTDLPLSLQKFSDISVTMFESAVPRSEQSTYAVISDAVSMVSGIYGNVDGLSNSVANITEVIAGQTALIDSISQSLADMDSKTLTDDEINQIVEDALSNYKDIADSVQDNTEDTAQNTATTNSWLSKIYSKLNAISKSVSGNNALKLEDDVSSQFKVMEGGDSDPGNDNEPPKITGIGAFVTVKLLQPVVEALDISLKNVTKWFSKVVKTITESVAQSTEAQVKAQEETTKAVNNAVSQIQELPESIPLSIPETLPDMFPKSIPLEIPDSLADMFPKSIPLEIPETFADIFPDSIPLTMPENFPESVSLSLPDLEPAMDKFLDKFKKLFELDLEPINDEINDNVEKLDKKLPVSQFKLVLDEFKFDDTYDYPVIKMKCPQILVSFLGESKNIQDGYLILFDGKDYADTFKMIRALLTALIWLTYAYACLCKFRVRFVLD